MALSTKHCECGCGRFTTLVSHTTTKDGYRKGDARRFILGHHQTGKPIHPNALAAVTRLAQARRDKALTNPAPTHSDRTSHERARKRLPLRPCEWSYLGGCHGRIDCAHLDGNPFNNDDQNLKNLCRSHHFLLDKGAIDPLSPKMPEFYVDRAGKRRYRHTLLKQHAAARERAMRANTPSTHIPDSHVQ
jgi:hypothetical protein